MTGHGEPPTIRPEIVEALLRAAQQVPSPATATALLAMATGDEHAAVLERLELRVVEAAAELAAAQAELDAIEHADARGYYRWRSGHRAWTHTHGRRPVTPTGPTGP